LSNIVDAEYEGYKFAVYDTDKLGRNIIDGKGWEPHLTEFMRLNLKSTDTFIDIGANFGLYTLSMARKVGTKGHVWAFEPTSTTAAFLKHSIELNKFDNTIIVLIPFFFINCVIILLIILCLIVALC